MHGIYKYIYNNEIIYIGKSDSSIKQRIQQHSIESKFLPYLSNAVIYYAILPNASMTAIYETFYINKFKPRLNVSSKYYGDVDIDIPEPEWREFISSDYWQSFPIKSPNKVIRQCKTKIALLEKAKDDLNLLVDMTSSYQDEISSILVDLSRIKRESNHRQRISNIFEEIKDSTISCIHLSDEVLNTIDAYNNKIDKEINIEKDTIQRLSKEI